MLYLGKEGNWGGEQHSKVAAERGSSILSNGLGSKGGFTNLARNGFFQRCNLAIYLPTKNSLKL